MKELLSNFFSVDLSEYANFSSNDGPIQGPVNFKYFARFYDEKEYFNDLIYNIGSYVLFSKEECVEKSKLIVDYLHKDMYINQYPKKNPFNINRFITKFAIRASDLFWYIDEISKELIKQNIKNTEQSKYYIHALIHVLKELYEHTKDKQEYETCILYVDILDSIINSSYIGLFKEKTKISIIYFK